MTNNMASSGMLENVMLTNIYTYHRLHHWLCDEWQMYCYVDNDADGKAM